MAMDRKKIYAELDWMNYKSLILVYSLTMLMSIAISLWAGVFLPLGLTGFILGIVVYVVSTLVQKRMARKMTDKIMKMHREDNTVHVDIMSGLPK